MIIIVSTKKSFNVRTFNILLLRFQQLITIFNKFHPINSSTNPQHYKLAAAAAAAATVAVVRRGGGSSRHRDNMPLPRDPNACLLLPCNQAKWWHRWCGVVAVLLVGDCTLPVVQCAYLQTG